MAEVEAKQIQVIDPNYQNIFQLAIAFIDKIPGENTLLLDAGCGRGGNTEKLRQLGFKTTGIDISAEDIEIAKSKFPENNFFQHDLNDRLPFEDGTFDVIFSNSVLQYIQWQKVIKEYKRILKPDGQIMLLENLQGNPLAKVYRTIMKLTKSYKQYYVPLKHVSYKELVLFDENFDKVDFKFCVLFSTASNVIPDTNKFYMRAIRKKLKYVLVKMENGLLKSFPSLYKYSSKVIIRVSRPK